MLTLKIKLPKVDISISLQDKFVLLSGDGCVGKTRIIKLLKQSLESGYDCVECNNPFYVISTNEEVKLIDTIVSSKPGIVLIVDEFLAHKVLYNSLNKDCYVIAVSRRIYSDINMSYRCLQKLYRDDDGITRNKVLHSVHRNNPIYKYDLVIVEDSKSGYDFIKRVFNNSSKVMSSSGKSNISKILDESTSAKSILVIADGGGLASDIKRIKISVAKRKRVGMETRFCLPECFEHVLLCYGFIKYDKDIFKYFKPKFNNTESFCEIKLYEETKGTVLEHNHDEQSLSECWIKDCAECDKQCSLRASGRKTEYVLSGGPSSCLLSCMLE